MGARRGLSSRPRQGTRRRREGTRLYLRDDIEAALRSGALGAVVPDGAAIAGTVARAVFEALYGIAGQVYRQTGARRTLRCDIGTRSYFAKLHAGAGWREVVAGWASLKHRGHGAEHEYRACLRLGEAGVRAPGVAAFGAVGGHPATRRSFVICDALDGCVSLEDIANDWALNPRPTAVKRQFLAAVGRLAAAMHDAGVCHRDFYLCHLLADAAKLERGAVALSVIDLHRAVDKDRHGTRRDLAALWHSADTVPLTRTDRLRFVAAYTGRRPAEALRRTPGFWAAVARRAKRLRSRAAARGLASGAGAATAPEAASIGRLEAIGRDAAVPFRFDADFGAGGVRVVCTEILRLQPGRRLVARARIAGGAATVVKAFFGRRGRRDWRREQTGHRALASTDVPVPRLLAAGRGAGAHLLAFERIAPAHRPGAADMGAVLAALARLHAGGVRQRDLHLGNFLVSAGTVYAVDGGAARRQRTGRRAALADAATLIADLPHDQATCAATFDGDERRVEALVAVARRRRAARFARKAVRDCTPFSVQVGGGRWVATARGDADAELAAVIADPEQAIRAGEPLKQGRTATVVRYGGLVVKRYNVKSRWHGWRLRLRRSRARRAWQAAHRLVVLGVATARPRAMIECGRAVPGNAAAYLVLDFVAGEAVEDGRGKAVRELFDGLQRARLAHGDMKATNFIVSGGVLHVLDLDAAVFHRCAWWFRYRHRRDRARFARNFAASEG